MSIATKFLCVVDSIPPGDGSFFRMFRMDPVQVSAVLPSSCIQWLRLCSLVYINLNSKNIFKVIERIN